MNRIARISKHVSPLLDGTSPVNQILELQPTASSSPIMDQLRGKIAALANVRSALKADLLKNNGETKIQEVTVEMCINGARNMKTMVTETSDLDAETGISYRGMSLYETNKALPKAPGGESGLPEAAYWLLLTGEVPTDAECKAFTQELHRRSTVPAHVGKLLAALPKGMKKSEYWEWALEDAVDLVAKIPVVAAMIYSNTFKDGSEPKYDSSLDWAGNYAQMLGVNDSEGFKECTRLYLMLHADHEGGNVSAHTAHLVGSALSDPYYSWAAGLCGLAGPLHGLANQECLAWLLEVQKELGGQKPTKELLVAYVEKTLKAGKVIPGFGHAVLRKPDPRYMLEREFALKHCKDDPLFELVDACYQAIPPTLEKTGKVKNPYPNVDAHSGQLMYYYNLKQENYYTVVFAVSRAIGVMSQYVWSRALGLPIERPKSVPLDVLQTLVNKAKK